MLPGKRSVGVAPEVHLRNPLEAGEEPTLALRPRGDVTRSLEQRISGPTKTYPKCEDS